MTSSTDELRLKGCDSFRLRLVYSTLSGRPTIIDVIRPLDNDPGIREHEAKLLSLIEAITNGTRIEINRTGTQVKFHPGLVHGGEVSFDCGTVRCISYFLEALLLLAPFCKVPLHVKLKGVTNRHGELSVDAMRATWLPVFNKFVLNDESLGIKINARGFPPDGGGSVTFTSPIVRVLRSVQRLKAGKIGKIRGLAYVCKVSPAIASRMIESAKGMLRGYLADVYITVDQRKGSQGGLSPGFGLFLTAETTEDIFYHGEAMSRPKGDSAAPATAEEVGRDAAESLLTEIYRGGCSDSSAQTLAATFMTLGDKNVSKYLFGPLTPSTVQALRHLKLFFGHTFKIDDPYATVDGNGECDDEGPAKKARRTEKRTGAKDKALLTCVGVGYSNMSKVML